MTAVRPPRRLSKEARREQLVAAAMLVVAEQGFGEFSLDEIASAADVTRNLLYHYFPQGREDVALAVVDQACRELTADWVVDESLPLSDRLTANFERMMDQALAPSAAWRVYRRARAAGEPEIEEIVAQYTESVISSISRNHLGRSKPSALVHVALTGFVAFAEAVLDETRITKAPRKRVMKLLSDTLVATIQAASG